MPSTRRQKAKEKRSKPSDMMSHLENMDVMLVNYPEENYEVPGGNDENEIDSRSNSQDQELVSSDE